MFFPFSARSGRMASGHRIGRLREGAGSASAAHFVRLQLEELEERCLLDGNPAIVPAPPPNAQGLLATNALLDAPKGNPQVVFLGDSITQFFASGAGASVWNSQIAPLNAADYGVAGNTTANVLWQIQNGQLSGIHPTVVVLMAGVNNLVDGGQTPFETAEGVAADVEAIELAQPQAHVLVLGILPVFASPYNPYRGEVAETNQLISSLAATPNVTYLNFGSDFLRSNGFYNSALTIDDCHPSEQGYRVEANAILPTIRHLLAEGPIPGAIPSYTAPTYSAPYAYGFTDSYPAASINPFAYGFIDPYAAGSTAGYAYPAPTGVTPPPATTTSKPATTPGAGTQTLPSGDQATPIINVLQNVAALQTAPATPLPASSSTGSTLAGTGPQATSLVSAAPGQADLSTVPGQAWVYTDQDGNPLT